MGFDFSTPLCSELLHITHNTYQIQFTEPPASFINYSKLFYFSPFSIMIPSSLCTHVNSAFMFFFLVVEFPLFPHVTKQSTAFRWEKIHSLCQHRVEWWIRNSLLFSVCELCTQRKASTFKAAVSVTMKINLGSTKSRPAVSATFEIFDFQHLLHHKPFIRMWQDSICDKHAHEW